MFAWRSRKNMVILVSVLALMFLFSGWVVGCGEQPAEEPAANGEPAEAEAEIPEEIELAMVEWTCSTQKNYIHKEILENLGYDVTLNNYALPVILEGLGDEQIDAFTDAWWVTWGTPLFDALDEGRVVHLDTHLEDVNYAPAVPVYVYEAGVTSMEDLADHSEEFGYTYYGLEPGNDGNEIMIEAFENDTYGLGEWDIVESNEAAMIADVGQVIERGEWVVFSGWEPHYMNVIFDMEYLEDPKGIWGDEPERVATIVRPGLEEEHPNLARYLKQFNVEISDVDQWVYAFGYEDRDPEEYAQEWVSENLDMVLEWVEGVTTVDGRDAQEALEEAYR